ncbi:MAG: CBS domain-containing protein [Chloroflexi bacterium]|nr:CBS domain-containing protein [Chloroflexota bacterium]MCH7654913.1 CBS domain-containing protein [Chloroflexota bacterium]
MKVADVMQRPVYSATPTTTAREVAVNLLMSRISGFPIVDHAGALIGIVTELDLIRAIRAGRDLEVTLAAEIMTSDVITVDAEEDVETVMETLDTEQIIRVPVTSEGRLVGVVARGDVIRAMLTPRFVLMG